MPADESPQQPPGSATAWIRDRFKQSIANRPATPEEKLPERIGRYTVIERVGRGAIANVYRATDGAKDIAIKVIRQDQAGAEAEAVFKREASILQGLRHPDIIQLHEIGREGDTLYLVMDFIPGPTLQYAIDEDTPRSELMTLLVRVARAVDFAHRHGVIHRDLKPQNILVGPDGPVVTDFGIARAMDAVTRTNKAVPIGTPTHMAPEQIDRRIAQLGPATDVWGLGVILYQILTRRLPFVDEDAAGIFARVLHDKPRAPTGLGPLYEAVCVRALEKDPSDRYASAATFADDLEAAMSGKPVANRHPIRKFLRRLFRGR